jgi:hypothetical protein
MNKFCDNNQQANLLCILSEKKEILLRMLRRQAEKPRKDKLLVRKRVVNNTTTNLGRRATTMKPTNLSYKFNTKPREGTTTTNDSLFKIRINVKKK